MSELTLNGVLPTSQDGGSPMRKNTRKLSQVGRKQIVVHQQARTNLVGSFLTFGSFFRSHQFLVEFSPRTMIWFIFSVTSIFGRIFTPNHDLVHFFGTSIFGRIFTPSHHLVHVKLVHSKPQTIIWFMLHLVQASSFFYPEAIFSAYIPQEHFF